MKRMALLRFLLLAALATSLPVQACTCFPRPTRELFCAADSIVLARVSAVSILGDEGAARSLSLVRFEVEREFKTGQTRRSQVLTSRWSGDCGVSFVPGRVALIFIGPGGFSHACGGTVIDVDEPLLRDEASKRIRELEAGAFHLAKRPSFCRDR